MANKHFRPEELDAEWARSCVLGGLHGLYAEGPRAALWERMMRLPHITTCASAHDEQDY